MGREINRTRPERDSIRKGGEEMIEGLHVEVLIERERFEASGSCLA